MNDYVTDWPGFGWPRDKKIVQKTPPSHGNGFVSVKTGPQVEPVTMDEVKAMAEVDGTRFDTLLETYIKAAREAVEDHLKKVLIEQTLVLSLDWWPEPLKLPRPPLISVVEVRTLTEEGVETAYSSDNYFVRTDTLPGQVVIKTGVTPPINTDRYHGGFEVEYKAGYGSDPDEVPARVRHGIMLLATHLLENPSASIAGAIIAEVPGLSKVLNGARRIRI